MWHLALTLCHTRSLQASVYCLVPWSAQSFPSIKHIQAASSAEIFDCEKSPSSSIRRPSASLKYKSGSGHDTTVARAKAGAVLAFAKEGKVDTAFDCIGLRGVPGVFSDNKFLLDQRS